MKENLFTVIDTYTGKTADPNDVMDVLSMLDSSLEFCGFECFAVGQNGKLYLLDQSGQWNYLPERYVRK